MKTKFLALALVAFAPFAVMADVSYNYIDFNYQFSGTAEDNLGGSSDTDGFGLRGSYGFNESWYVRFDYASLATDPDAGDIDDLALSVGWHNELFFAQFGYVSGDYIGLDDSGFGFDVGVRTMVSDGFELNAHLGMGDYGDIGTSTNYGLGAVWMFNDSMGVSFNYDLRSISDFAEPLIGPGLDVDFDTMGLGFRMNFN